jgi:ABC-type polar amino acid transport system ATPase subunit
MIVITHARSFARIALKYVMFLQPGSERLRPFPSASLA